MALDGAFLYAIRNELSSLIGGRVEKIHQPSREEIIISLRTRNGGKKLYISANAASARVRITENTVDNQLFVFNYQFLDCVHKLKSLLQ